jgi:hypothetical protein
MLLLLKTIRNDQQLRGDNGGRGEEEEEEGITRRRCKQQ